MSVTTAPSAPWTPRVPPRVWIGLAIWVVYVALVFVIQQSSGIAYTEWGESGSNLFFGVGVSLLAGTLLLAVAASVLGWWRPALFERQRSVRWPIIAPALMAAALLINLLLADWASFDAAFLAASVVLILVGFTEEMANRGLLIVALRSRLGEGWVWFVSTALFAAMHLMNVLIGQGLVPTLSQVGAAFLAGTTLYILRRTTGSLIWAMLLHGLWDFSVFAVGHGSPSSAAPLGGILEIAVGLLALAVVVFVIRGARERVEPAATARPGASVAAPE